MNGTNGNEPGYPEKALVPYPVILAATKGDPDAMKIVLQHFSGYIARLSMRKDVYKRQPFLHAALQDPFLFQNRGQTWDVCADWQGGEPGQGDKEAPPLCPGAA